MSADPDALIFAVGLPFVIAVATHAAVSVTSASQEGVGANFEKAVEWGCLLARL